MRRPFWSRDVRVTGPEMTDEPREEELTPEELEETNGEPLPDREAMSVITPPDGFTLPVEPPAKE